MPSVFPEDKTGAQKFNKKLRDSAKILSHQQYLQGKPEELGWEEREKQIATERKKLRRAKMLVWTALIFGAIALPLANYSMEIAHFTGEGWVMRENWPMGGWIALTLAALGIVCLIKRLLSPYGSIGFIGIIAFVLCFLALMIGIGVFYNSDIHSPRGNAAQPAFARKEVGNALSA